MIYIHKGKEVPLQLNVMWYRLHVWEYNTFHRETELPITNITMCRLHIIMSLCHHLTGTSLLLFMWHVLCDNKVWHAFRWHDSVSQLCDTGLCDTGLCDTGLCDSRDVTWGRNSQGCVVSWLHDPQVILQVTEVTNLHIRAHKTSYDTIYTHPSQDRPLCVSTKHNYTDLQKAMIDMQNTMI